MGRPQGGELDGVVDGINRIFTVPGGGGYERFVEAELNGVGLPSNCWIELDPLAGTIELNFSPRAADGPYPADGISGLWIDREFDEVTIGAEVFSRIKVNEVSASVVVDSQIVRVEQLQLSGAARQDAISARVDVTKINAEVSCSE